MNGYAAQTISMQLDALPQTLDFDTLTGVALRRNPKRAHLLVSRVLGKHTPQSPAIIDAAGRILAVRAAGVLVPYAPDTDGALRRLGSALQIDTPAPRVPKAPETDAIVVGFAEAASALGATVAMHLGAYYVCSTRTPLAPVYGEFTEEHSHASAHFLTPADPARLSDTTKPIILVDDELTTGRTAMNLIRALHATAPHPEYVIATLADLRDATAHEHMAQFAVEVGVPVTVVSLFAGEITTAVDAIDRAQEAIDAGPTVRPTSPGHRTEASQLPIAAEVPHARDGIASFAAIDSAAAAIARALPAGHGPTLVLGVEEDMTLALRVAAQLHAAGRDVTYSSTTRSPAAVFDRPDYPLRDALTFTGHDDAPRFVYNLGDRFAEVVIIASDPLYFENARRLTAGLHGRVRKVTTVTTTPLQDPLRGPAFGSYQADDVAWLVKDLADAALEVDLDEREERVQSGGHYAESLPVEYQPEPEYLEMFWAALRQNRRRVAEDVQAVGERIWAARNGRPVLVSLARAGTPVGVLLRRYFQHAHGADVPHYAVSIVRGRGIDANALSYLAAHHDPADIIFVDGWTGKGAIKSELDAALTAHAFSTGVVFPTDLAVLADTAQVTSIYGTRDDYLIPSAALNSTVSGLVSRTVLNDDLIGADDYHGAKFYAELADADVSQAFVDDIAEQFPDLPRVAAADLPLPEAPTWTAWEAVERISEEYGIGSVNLVKPGVGETTRVLLRRVPWRILLNPDAGAAVTHIRMLAAARGVPIEEVPDLAFNAVGLIHPQHSKGATDFDGRAAVQA